MAPRARESTRSGAAGSSERLNMSVLNRYVSRSVLGHTALVLLVLMVLSGLYLFTEQQDDIGVGSFTTVDALAFVGLYLPKYAFDLLPIAALIGALLSLGNLARSMELIVVRAAGVSTARVGVWVFGAGLLVMAATWVLGEFVAPPMEQYARQMKTFKKYRDYSMAGNRTAWAKDGDTIIAVQQQSAGNRYAEVNVYKFDSQHRLRTVGRANSGSIDTHNRWRLDNYRESRLEGDRVVATRVPSAQLETRLSSEFLGLATVEPDSLPALALRSYAQHLRSNGLDARTYETAFWARIARTVAVAVSVVLAVPFAFGPMRSTGTGARTVVGILIGVAFFLVAKVLENGGAVFGLSPIVVAWGPTALLTLITVVAVARVR
jgi:lipopolysaccharide export system permease protein